MLTTAQLAPPTTAGLFYIFTVNDLVLALCANMSTMTGRKGVGAKQVPKSSGDRDTQLRAVFF